MNEFELIQRYFTRPSQHAVLGQGDDAAIVRPSAGQDLHVSTDMLVVGRHFFADVSPHALGHKALAVNLSDMAAMGAKPRWVVLAAAIPEVNEAWLAAFAEGFFALAQASGVELIGGDTTRGPLTLSLTILGETPQGQALRRDAAQAGDDIWVSGELGLAALALRARLAPSAQWDALPSVVQQAAWHKLEYPSARNALGQALLGVAHAAADVSDGLLADLGHIAQASGLAAEVVAASLPSLPIIEAQRSIWLDDLAAGGDDYELLFTAAPSAKAAVLSAAAQTGCRVTCIGKMLNGQGVKLINARGVPQGLDRAGYDHFA